MKDYKLRLNMSEKGKRLVDSGGLNRIWEAVSNYYNNKDDGYAKDRVE